MSVRKKLLEVQTYLPYKDWVNEKPQTVNTDMRVMITTCDIKHGLSIEEVYKISEAVIVNSVLYFCLCNE